MVESQFPSSLAYPTLSEITDSEDPFQYYRLAKIKYEKNSFDEAQELIQEAIEMDDDNAIYYYLHAQILYAKGKEEESLDNALKSYSLGYINPDLQVLIAKQYYKVGEPEKGEEYLDIAVKKRPNDPEMRFLKAVTYLQNRDTSAGISWLKKTLAVDSSFNKAYLRMAEVFIAKDSINDAIKMYRRSYRNDTTDVSILYTIASLEMTRENWSEAELWLEKLVAVDQDNFSGYLQLSKVKMELRAYDSARYFAEKALTYDRSLNDARLLMARSYDKQYRYNDALKIYEDIIQRDSTFEIALVEKEQLEKKIAYLRRRRLEQDSMRNSVPAELLPLRNSDNNND